MSDPDRHIIIGVHVTNRVHRVSDVQKVLTEYGCYIKTRLGLHEASQDFCSPNGLIVLDLLDDEQKRQALLSALRAIDGVEVQEMVFTH